MLEVLSVMFYTRWTHAVVCVMTILTDKAAKMLNQWEYCLKSMVYE